MSSVQYDEKQPAGGAASPLRFLIGTAAIVFFVALVALGAREPSGTVASVETGGRVERADQRSPNAPVFDGRGKWGGY